MENNKELVEIKTKIIQSLNNGKYYNKRHTPINNVCKRISSAHARKSKEQLKNLEKKK